MKKIFYFAIAVLALAACHKEVETIAPVVSTHTVTIKAALSEETRTAYDGEGKFSWLEGDKIAVLTANVENDIKVVSFTASKAGAVTEFTGEVEEGYEVMDVATYPYTQVYDGYGRNDFVWEPTSDGTGFGYRIWGSVKPLKEAPLASNPLTGMKDEWGVFQFRSAMGVVKFTVENMREDAAYLYLEIPADAEGYLNGWFNIDEEGVVKMSNAVDGWKDRYNWNVPTAAGETVEYYFFVPVGTIPAGLKVEVCNSSWAAIESYTTVQPIEIQRNIITKVAALRMEDSPYSLENVIGTYQMKVTAGPYSTNAETGDCVFEASDDPAKGTVMLTKFAGISGKQYGKIVGSSVIFDKDQLFGANPYDNAADYPYVALDAFSGSVIDVEFEIVEPHYLKFVGSALGFRATTENLWLNDSHNGAWPWSLCFGSVQLKPEWVEEAPELEAGQVWVKSTMISAIATATYDGGGVPALVDGDATTYWHSDYYYKVANNDPVYGIYIDIALENALQKYHYEFITRSANSGASPTHIVYGVSNDGVTWTKVGEADTNVTTDTGGGVRVKLGGVEADAAYKYLRFGITDSTNGDPGSFTIVGDEAAGGLNWDGYKKCVNLAELLLFAD